MVPSTMQLFVVRWEESERGWGVRPDGHTLHTSQEEWLRFIAEYEKSLPREAPDEYSRPATSGWGPWKDAQGTTIDVPDDGPIAKHMEGKQSRWTIQYSTVDKLVQEAVEAARAKGTP